MPALYEATYKGLPGWERFGGKPFHWNLIREYVAASVFWEPAYEDERHPMLRADATYYRMEGERIDWRSPLFPFSQSGLSQAMRWSEDALTQLTAFAEPTPEASSGWCTNNGQDRTADPDDLPWGGP